MYVCYVPLYCHQFGVYWCGPRQVVYSCIQQEFVIDLILQLIIWHFHILLVSFEVTIYIHIQYKMELSTLFLASLTLSCLPISLSYRDGARSESCYNMLVMHINGFTGQVAPSTECGNTCPFELRLVGRVNAESRLTPMETTYQFGETYHCK